MKLNNISLKKRLMLYIIALLIFAMFIISFTIHNLSKKALDENGKIVLKNATEMAMLLADSYYSRVVNGNLSRKKALEKLKIKLIGPLNEDGTRDITNNIDLGEHGYFIIYDLDGKEIMHPKIEGEDAWNVVDPLEKGDFIVRDQISLALDGGGFKSYNWEFPDSDKIGSKITYSEYNENWDFVIVSTAYEKDFDKAANKLLKINFILFIIVLIFGFYISKIYVERINKPIYKLIEAMKKVDQNKYEKIDNVNREDEIGELMIGFNQMIEKIKIRNENIRKKSDQIKYLAYHDELTELPNYNLFKNVCNEYIKKDINFYIMQIDIDDLKTINSIMGFEKGNKIIKIVSETLKKIRKKDEFVSRTSGNEFSIISKNSQDFFNRFNNIFLERIKNEEIYSKIKFHKSVVNFPKHGESFDELFNKVNVALSYAKKFNKSIVYYEVKMTKHFSDKSKMKKAIVKAFENNEFYPVYQYKVDKDINIIGVEGLLRWESENLGNVSPGIFIPYINKSNRINEFGEYTLNLFLRDFSKLQEKFNKNISISINISPKYFVSKNFIPTIISTIKKYNVPFEKVILEITEDLFIKDFNLVDRIINKLHKKGIKISIDDFGTGYSSLNYIQKINADELKIDKSFVHEILEDEQKRVLFHSICKIAKTYNFEIVVEGVETQKQSEEVMTEDINYVQGYFYSIPEDLEDYKIKNLSN